MGVGNFLEQLASAFMQKRRAELGITEAERKASESESENLLKQAQRQRLIQQLELAPAEAKSEQALRAAQIGNYEAQAEDARAQAAARNQPKRGTPEYKVDEQGVVHAITPTGEGGFETVTIGPYGQRPRDVRSPTVHISRERRPTRSVEYDPVKRQNVIRWYDDDGNVVREGMAPLSAEESKRSGIVTSVGHQVGLMEKLAADLSNEGVTAPLVGGIQIAKDALTREGPGADFDFAAKLATDIVYQKSGAQINPQEQAGLKQVTPRRDRGNLPGQVRRFRAYVTDLFKKYGIEDDIVAGGGAPTEQPGSGFRVIAEEP